MTASSGATDTGSAPPLTHSQADPARADPAQTDPARADPAQTDPAQTDPAQTDPAQTDPARAPRSDPALTGLVGEALIGAVADLGRADGPASVRVLDCGGGSGTLAVPLAGHGCRVTVVDTSIDALSILERRAREAGVAERVLAVQGDIENLTAVVAAGSMDLVLLHGVLEPGAGAASLFAAAAGALRPGGVLSVLAGNPAGAVLARALSGELDAALAELDAASEPLSVAGLSRLADDLGLDVVLVQGVDAFSSTVPGNVLASRPRAADALNRLDRRAATRAPYRDIAGQLHVLARRRIVAASDPASESASDAASESAVEAR